jgi:hypothetical protein
VTRHCPPLSDFCFAPFIAKGSDAAHIITGALKGFLIGFGIRAGQWLLGYVLRGGKASSKGSPAFSELMQQASKIGSFLALLVGGTRALQFAMKLMNINRRAAAFISGAVAGASSVFYPSIEVRIRLFLSFFEVSFLFPLCANFSAPHKNSLNITKTFLNDMSVFIFVIVEQSCVQFLTFLFR